MRNTLSSIRRIARGMRPALVAACVTLTLITPTLAAPLKQSDTEAKPILLGEYVFLQMAADDTAAFVVEIDEDGTYLLTTSEAAEAEKFDIVITGSQGDEILAAQFAETELSLDDGEYTIEVTANEDGLLSLVLLGEFGEMSDDSDNPGELYNGGVYSEEAVDSVRYATLTIPDLESPQEVLVYIAAGEEGGFSAYLSGDDAYASIDTVDTNLLRFWTQGGEYTLEITPTGDATNLQVIPFLSGPVSTLALGEEVTGSLSDEKDTAAYQFEVSQAGALVTIAMTSDVEDSDFELSVGAQPSAGTWTSYRSGSEEDIQFVAPVAGIFYVVVSSSSGSGEFKLMAEEGDLAPELALDDLTWGSVEAESTAVYRLQVDAADQMLAIILVGAEDVDLDLTITSSDEEGNSVHYFSSINSGSAEIASQALAQPGLYEVKVSAPYDSSNFFILTRLLDPATVASQWAMEAVASSEYGSDTWSAQQATGMPDTGVQADAGTAWASASADGEDLETLELTYEHPVKPSYVNIYESYNPGAVISIEAYNEEEEEWAILWEGEDESVGEAGAAPVIFSPALETIDFATNKLRITLDSSAVEGYNEIDAVELVGRP